MALKFFAKLVSAFCSITSVVINGLIKDPTGKFITMKAWTCLATIIKNSTLKISGVFARLKWGQMTPDQAMLESPDYPRYRRGSMFP